MQFQTSNGYTVLIDVEDYHKIKHLTWYGQRTAGTVYATASIKNKNIRLHRYILGAPPDKVVDHVNGNGLDNRRQNIRVCTQSENLRNKSRLSARNTTGHAGVTKLPSGRYCVAINMDSDRYGLGICDTLDDAGKIRRLAELFLYGAFAPRNSGVNTADAVLVHLGFIMAALYSKHVPGVSWSSHRQKWLAYLKGQHIGLFEGKEEAVAARKLAEIHGVPQRIIAESKTAVEARERAMRVAEKKRVAKDAAETKARHKEYIKSLQDYVAEPIDELSFLDPCKLLDTPPQTA